jgi:outer membrane protein assembly factor BamD (BamD/ComL family)
MNSVEAKKKDRIEKAIERYRTFVTDFPESSYKKVADKISDDVNEEFQKIELNK